MSGTIIARKKQKKNNKGYSRWSDLPCDLLDLIGSRLYAGDSIMFRAVCKSWRQSNIPQPVQLHPMQVDTLPNMLMKIDPQLHNNIPYLMNLNCKTGLFHFHHPITNATYIVDLPGLEEQDIRFSKDGWLLVCHRPKSIFFFNPFTRARIQLPKIPLAYGFRSMHFSCSPTLSACTVFGVLCNDYEEDVYIGTFRHGSNRWSIRRFINNEDFIISKCSPVLYKGLYYCLGQGGNLGIFNPKSRTWNVLEEPLATSRRSFLLESDGKLFGIFGFDDGRKVEVFRLKKSSNIIWHKVENLNDRMFYVCGGSSYSHKAVIQGTGNKIYFPKFYNDKSLFYSLGTKHYHSFLDNFTTQDLLDTKELKHGIWINMPIQEN